MTVSSDAEHLEIESWILYGISMSVIATRMYALCNYTTLREDD